MTRQGTNALRVLVALVSAGLAAYFAVPWSDDADGNDAIVARVGERAITVREFRANYELGYPHLKHGNGPKERKRSYLRAMVNELLITGEGFRHGLDMDRSVRDRDERITTELLTEALIREEIVARTRVSDDEVRSAINRSKVSFRLRYWGEPTLARAQAIRQAMARNGYMPVVDSLRRVHAELSIDPSMLESGEMNAFEIDPDVLEAVKNLEIGGLSVPVSLNGGHYIFQVVDIRRHALLEHEYASRFASVKKVLLNMKYDEGIASYVGGFMTAKKVVTKGQPFGALCDAVVAWKGSGEYRIKMLRDAVFQSPPRHPAYSALAALRNEPLVVFEGGQYTVAEFLEFYAPSLRDIDPGDPGRVRHLVSEQVALAMRDRMLAAEARRRGLDRHPDIVRDREQWLRKAVYDATCNRLVGPVAGRADIEKARRVLEHTADSLRAVVPVNVNENVLDTLTVHDAASSRMLGMQVFKLGSKRPAIPVTDGIWGRIETVM